jgi:hypothetical protein
MKTSWTAPKQGATFNQLLAMAFTHIDLPTFENLQKRWQSKLLKKSNLEITHLPFCEYDIARIHNAT